MNAANWTSVAFKFFECSDHRVDVTLTTNFLYKSVYCSIFFLFSLGFLSRTGLVELEPALRALPIDASWKFHQNFISSAPDFGGPGHGW